MDQEIDLDALIDPAAVPDLGIGDLIKWAPVLEKLITGVEQAMATGGVTVPDIKFKLAGKHVDLGPIPIKVSG